MGSERVVRDGSNPPMVGASLQAYFSPNCQSLCLCTLLNSTFGDPANGRDLQIKLELRLVLLQAKD